MPSSKYDNLILDLMAVVMVSEVTLPELRFCVDEIERNLRDLRKRTTDIRARRKVDAALGLKPWPEDNR